MPEIITLGEALVEIMRPTTGQPLDQPGEFHGPFPSGAPAIFAVAAARLGMEVGIIGVVGDDAFGRLMRNSFIVEGVDASQLQISPGYATGAAFVAYDETGEREFVFYIRHAAAGQLSADQIQAEYFENVKWLHLSGFQNDECLDIPGYAVDEIDPTGAGDCFSAGFIAGLEAGWPLEKAGRFANATGALAVTQMGPMEGAPTRSQVEQKLW